MSRTTSAMTFSNRRRGGDVIKVKAEFVVIDTDSDVINVGFKQPTLLLTSQIRAWLTTGVFGPVLYIEVKRTMLVTTICDIVVRGIK